MILWFIFGPSIFVFKLLGVYFGLPCILLRVYMSRVWHPAMGSDKQEPTRPITSFRSVEIVHSTQAKRPFINVQPFQHIEMVELLIKSNVDINFAGENGTDTPLVACCREGHIELFGTHDSAVFYFLVGSQLVLSTWVMSGGIVG